MACDITGSSRFGSLVVQQRIILGTLAYKKPWLFSYQSRDLQGSFSYQSSPKHLEPPGVSGVRYSTRLAAGGLIPPVTQASVAGLVPAKSRGCG
ncbi:uncharacterized protein LOC134518163 isoform X2 [Chroicocephalus ridibundus]|uniref:uncharacterized protein LOC134518163 isoform X2 n=1 Tax=Chroicocephalus ridibundus TaxID=1192867 RepID=UPI002FDD784C